LPPIILNGGNREGCFGLRSASGWSRGRHPDDDVQLAAHLFECGLPVLTGQVGRNGDEPRHGEQRCAADRRRSGQRIQRLDVDAVLGQMVRNLVNDAFVICSMHFNLIRQPTSIFLFVALLGQFCGYLEALLLQASHALFKWSKLFFGD
jgi:hypothetical protein